MGENYKIKGTQSKKMCFFMHFLKHLYPRATKSSYQEPTMQRCQHKQIVAASKEYFGPKTWRSKKGENVLKKWEWRCWAESCFDKSVVVTWTRITQGVLPCLIFVLVQDRYKVRVKICTQWTSQRLMSCWLCLHTFWSPHRHYSLIITWISATFKDINIRRREI